MISVIWEAVSVKIEVEHSTVISVTGSGVVVVEGVLVLSDVIVVVNTTPFVDVATVATDFGPEAVMHCETSVLVKAGGAGCFFPAAARATKPEITSGAKIILKECSSGYYD